MVEAATGQSIRKYFHLQESGAPSQQLILGRVPAAFVNPPEVIALAKTGKFRQLITVQQIFQQKFGDPLVLSGGFTATRNFIAHNRRFVNDLEAALQDAWDAYIANPAAVIAVAAKQSGVSPQQLGSFGTAIGLPVVPRAKRVITKRDVKTWSELYPLLARSGFLKRSPHDAAKYFLDG
jgi:ABC-type nitrate/sulfonate/bicarbonate transport system substrate-binding protein